MPHTNDLQTNSIFEGVNGERWIVTGAVNSPDEMLLTLKKLEVIEKVVVAPAELDIIKEI